ncbi:MAG: endonuclease/exonuclease/phosphatase family protein [Pseudomonadota bacterium]
MRNKIKWLFLLGVTGAIFLVLGGFANPIHPAFDTMAQFRLHLSAGLISSAVLLLLFRKPVFSLIALAVGVLGASFVTSGTTLSAKTLAPLPGQPFYQIFHLNLYWKNQHKADVVERILEIDPQLISVAEVAGGWDWHLKKFESRWPHTAHCPEWSDRGGIKIYSKWKLDNSNDFCGDYGSLLLTRVSTDDGINFALGSAHPRWPWPASGPRQIATHLPHLQQIGEDGLIVGDFNSTTWSWSLQQFANAGGLKIFDGIGATWFFGSMPAPIVRIAGLPIDNVMSKGKIRILSARTIDSMGSDHLPLLIDFQLEAP